MEVYRDKQWVLPDTRPLPAVEFARRQIDALTVLKTEVDPIEREALGLSRPSGLAAAESGDTTYIVILRGTDRVIELDPGVVETAMSAPSLEFARLEQSIALGSGVSIRTVTVQRRATLVPMIPWSRTSADYGAQQGISTCANRRHASASIPTRWPRRWQQPTAVT